MEKHLPTETKETPLPPKPQEKASSVRHFFSALQRDHRVETFFFRLQKLIGFTFKKFSDDACFERAASLSYVSIISTIPLLVLFFSIVSILGLYQEMISYIHDTVLPFVVPEFQDQLIQIITDYISPTVFTGHGSGLINLLAILSLLMSATGVLITAERIFNQIWRVKETRSYVQKITAFWVILTTSPFLILASVWLADYLGPSERWFNVVSRHILFFRAIYDQFLLLFVGFIAFSLLLIFTPSVRVRFRAAAVGGVISAILWELSKKGFYFYVVNVGTVTNFYKQIAMLPLFLIWVFLTWMIILLGAEISYTVQNLEILIREQEEEHSGKRHSMAFLALSLLYAILNAYKKGKNIPPLDQIAPVVGIRLEELNNVARTLVEMNILIEDAAMVGRFTLIKSPENLNLREIVEEMRMREFPNEAILAIHEPKKLSSPDKMEVQDCVEYLFSHAEKAYMDVFSTEIEFSHYFDKLKK